MFFILAVKELPQPQEASAFGLLATTKALRIKESSNSTAAPSRNSRLCSSHTTLPPSCSNTLRAGKYKHALTLTGQGSSWWERKDE